MAYVGGYAILPTPADSNRFQRPVILNVIPLKSDSKNMLAFEITVNGKVVCTAGAGPKHRVLATALSWTHRDPGRFGFTVGGVAESDQHFNYAVPEVSVGDEITIRIIETDAVDDPDEIRPGQNQIIARLDDDSA